MARTILTRMVMPWILDIIPTLASASRLLVRVSGNVLDPMPGEIRNIMELMEIVVITITYKQHHHLAELRVGMARFIYIIDSALFLLSILSAAYLDVAHSSAMADTQGSTEMLGNTCELRKNGILGLFAPWSKDPGEYTFGAIRGKKSLFVGVYSIEKSGCDKIIYHHVFNTQNLAGQNMIFNCAVIGQPYKRYLSYMGFVSSRSTLEYTMTSQAWVFDFSTGIFHKFPHPERVYCANDIMDGV